MDISPVLARSRDGLGRQVAELAGPAVSPQRRDCARWVGRFLDVGDLRVQRARVHAGRRDRGRSPLPRRSQGERLWAVLEMLADFRVVSYRNLAEECFDGHAFTAGRGLRRLLEQGVVAVRTVQPRRSRSRRGERGFKVLALTPAGARAVRVRRAARGSDRRVWEGFVRPRELEHDAGVSELVIETAARVTSLGGAVESVRLEAELKAQVARAERRGSGKAEARAVRARAAARLGVPVDADGTCHFPDALLEVRDAEGVLSVLALELVTGSYSRRQVLRKMEMGMVLASHGVRLVSMLRSILRADDGGGRVRRAWRPGSEFEEKLFDVMR